MASGVSRLGTVYMPLEGLVDADAEIKRLSGQLDKMAADINRMNATLSNMDFVGRAPAEIVARQTASRDELVEKSEKVRKIVATLTALKG